MFGEKDADRIEETMRQMENDPAISKRALRLYMQSTMPCGHAVGNLLTCSEPPWGCVICNDEQSPTKDALHPDSAEGAGGGQGVEDSAPPLTSSGSCWRISLGGYDQTGHIPMKDRKDGALFDTKEVRDACYDEILRLIAWHIGPTEQLPSGAETPELRDLQGGVGGDGSEGG